MSIAAYKARRFRAIADRWDRHPRAMTAAWLLAFGLSLAARLHRHAVLDRLRQQASPEGRRAANAADVRARLEDIWGHPSMAAADWVIGPIVARLGDEPGEVRFYKARLDEVDD